MPDIALKDKGVIESGKGNERKDSPVIRKVTVGLPHRIVKVLFSEEVTVRGKPYVLTKAGDTLRWSEKKQ